MVTAPAIRAVGELALACAAVLGCMVSWSQVCSTALVAPIADGEPVTTSVSYDPRQLLLTLLLAAAAGVLGVVGAARMCRVAVRHNVGAVTSDTIPKIP